jgi:hypothetical protein
MCKMIYEGFVMNQIVHSIKSISKNKYKVDTDHAERVTKVVSVGEFTHFEYNISYEYIWGI